MSNITSKSGQIRAEIAAAAARLIAEEGADYVSAKKKAARTLLGGSRINGDFMPDNAQIEDEVRIYNEIFFADIQPARLRYLRELTLQLMAELEQFDPHVHGAVLNGTAGPHSDIHLQLFVDSTKDVEIFLLNKNVDFDISEPANSKNGGAEEVVSFMWRNEGVHLSLHSHAAQRNLPRMSAEGRLLRLNIAGFTELVSQESA